MVKLKRNNIILIGFMGSGKTCVGEQLAKLLKYRFLDTDAMIEQSERNTISHLFAAKGEEYFRELETALLLELNSALSHAVLATGGGMPLRDRNRELLRELGFVVYLRASVDTTVNRLRLDTTRPLLRGENFEERVKRLQQIRNPIYEAVAHKIIDTDLLIPEEIAGQLLSEFNKRFE